MRLDRRTLIAFWVAAAAGLTTGTAAAAQDPTRAGVTRPAGPGVLTGRVTDTTSLPIEGVEVMLVASRQTAHTGPDGRFRFDDLPRGRYDVRARKIGYDSQVRAARVDDDGGAVDFRLTPRPQALPPVITTASRGGISGVVTDTLHRPISGVEVRLMGRAQRATTGADGAFLLDARPGPNIIRVSGAGYLARFATVRVPPDSGRHVTISLLRGSARANRARLNAEALSDRMAWRTSQSTFLTREDIARTGRTHVGEIVRMSSPNPIPTEDPPCEAFVDGGPETRPLWYFDADDVEGIEIYAPGSLNLVRGVRMQPAVVRGRTGRGGAVRVCPEVYVWLR